MSNVFESADFEEPSPNGTVSRVEVDDAQQCNSSMEYFPTHTQTLGNRTIASYVKNPANS